MAVVRLASRYGRYGYRHVTAMLQWEGWRVNHKRVERIWRRGGLKVPAKQPKRGRLWVTDGSCVRLRPQRRNHVWAYDSVARKIVSGEEEDEAETVEAVFAQARDAEAVAEEYLVDDGWKAVEVEPTVVETHRNGNGVEPSVELVMGNGRHANGNGAGRAAAPVNGNGRHEEAAEGQQSLFSWAEFMAETPVKPSRRNGKPQLEAISMFEWALSLEKGREEELVDAGR